MTTRQLPLPTFDGLTPFDRQLLAAITDGADPETRAVSSLFNIAVNQSGLSYWWALYRLEWLEMLGYVQVERRGPGLPLTIRLT